MRTSSGASPISAPTTAPSGRCPACGAAETCASPNKPRDYEYGVEPSRQLRFLLCRACDSEWLHPRPELSELRSFYPDGYHAYHDDHGRVARMLVGIRGRLRARQYGKMFPPEGGWLFDVGAGDCRHFDELARNPSIRFAGVELNAALAEKAREAGHDVEPGTLEEMDLSRHLGRYQVVSMNHVLEHVIDPGEVLHRAWRILRPGGRIVGQLPTLSTWEHRVFGPCWAGYHYPRHLQLYSRPALAGTLGAAGFGDVRIRSTPHVQTALSVQNWLVARGVRTRLGFGRAPWFGALLLLSLPIEVLAFLRDRSGVIDFEARKPVDAQGDTAA